MQESLMKLWTKYLYLRKRQLAIFDELERVNALRCRPAGRETVVQTEERFSNSEEKLSYLQDEYKKAEYKSNTLWVTTVDALGISGKWEWGNNTRYPDFVFTSGERLKGEEPT